MALVPGRASPSLRLHPSPGGHLGPRPGSASEMSGFAAGGTEAPMLRRVAQFAAAMSEHNTAIAGQDAKR